MTGWKLKTGKKKGATDSLRSTKIDYTRIKKFTPPRPGVTLTSPTSPAMPIPQDKCSH